MSFFVAAPPADLCYYKLIEHGSGKTRIIYGKFPTTKLGDVSVISPAFTIGKNDKGEETSNDIGLFQPTKGGPKSMFVWNENEEKWDDTNLLAVENAKYYKDREEELQSSLERKKELAKQKHLRREEQARKLREEEEFKKREEENRRVYEAHELRERQLEQTFEAEKLNVKQEELIKDFMKNGKTLKYAPSLTTRRGKKRDLTFNDVLGFIFVKWKSTEDENEKKRMTEFAVLLDSEQEEVKNYVVSLYQEMAQERYERDNW